MSRRVPKRRFKGFEGEWEQRKLSDITEKIGSGKTPLGGMEAYVDKGVALIRSQNVNHDMVDLSDVVFIDEETDTSMKGSRVHTDDVLLNITGASIGRSAVYKRIEHANVNQHVCIIRPNNNYDSSFIQLNLASLKGQKQIELSQSGSGREGLNFKQIGKFNFYYPIKKEQVEIGTYFSKFDKLITLHQQKYDKLQALKKAYLYEMFPQEGESVPKRRFAGFSGDWEKKVLNNIVNGINRVDATSKAPVMMITAQHGFIKQSERYSFDNAGESLKKYIILNKGELAYNHGASKVRPYGSCFALKEEYARVPFVYHCFSVKENNSEFISIVLNSKNVERQLKKLITSGARMDGLLNISFKEYCTVEILVPDITEQNKIADFFEIFDQHISEIDSKLQKLKALKQAYLVEMFV